MMMAAINNTGMNPMHNLSDKPALLPACCIVILIAEAVTKGRLMGDKDVHCLLGQRVHLLLGDNLASPPTFTLHAPLLVD